jgi:hypothetical protein
MYIVEITGYTDDSGDASEETTQRYNGYVEKVVVDYDDTAIGADFTLTQEGSISESILAITDVGTSDLVKYPRAKPVDNVNSEITNTATKFYVSGTLKLVVAQGGSRKNFRVLVYISQR